MFCRQILIYGAVFIWSCGVAAFVRAEEAGAGQAEVFGEAETADGQMTEFLVKQGENEPNPLGNPLPENEEENQAASEDAVPAGQAEAAVKAGPAAKVISQENMQNPTVSEEPNPADMKDKIQDTLYESGGRIYDIQSYPAGDVEQIESPAQPTVTNYPAY